MPKRAAAAVLFIVITIAAITPIRSYDYFWHLTAGRWMADHRAIPRTDPLAVAGAKTEWINGEWLYEIVLSAFHRIGADPGIAIINALLIAAIFTAAFWFASERNDAAVALLAAAIAFAGASDRIGVRPSAAAALLIVIALGLLSSRLQPVQLTITYALVTIVWINVHPSALLAPFLAAATILVNPRRWLTSAISAAALLVNPWGWKAIAAPFHLTGLIGSQEFVNAEWLPSPPAIFPLLYGSVAVVFLLFLLTQEKRQELRRLGVFLVLAALAIRYVRNQSLYFAALPLLIPPLKRPSRKMAMAIAGCSIVPITWAFLHDVHTPGVDAQRFPTRAVSALRQMNLPGNIYNVDQFGGLLEWTFYPQRRVLTDGRNELFRDFIAEDTRARRDSRAWHALVRKYAVNLAVDEYQADRIEVVDVATGEHRTLPASLVRYRRRDWALIAFDDAAMIFARRVAFSPQAIAEHEYRYLVPDDPSFGYANPSIREAARAEIARAKRMLGESTVIQDLERALKN